jgi:ribosomal protein L39E
MPSQTEQSSWAPRAYDNPYRVWGMTTAEEWKQISRWYPFSVRVLVTTTNRPEWREQARCSTWQQAREVMQLLGKAHEKDAHLPAWVVMKCELRGKDGRERPVLWYPAQGSVLYTLRSTGKIRE